MSPGRRRALAYGAAAVAAAGAGIWAGVRLLSGGGPVTEPSVASPLDATAYPDLAGKPRRIAEWRGKVVAVNFWATWCAPCREEIPLFMEVRREWTSQGFEVVGIAIDNADKVAEYAKNAAISYPVLIADGSGLDLIRKLGNASGGLPYTAFLDRGGRPVRTKLGALTRPELDTLLAELMP